MSEILRTEMLAVFFTPEAIQQAFDTYAADDPRRLWVDAASDDDLRELGMGCLDSPILWRTFHDVIELEVEAKMLDA